MAHVFSKNIITAIDVGTTKICVLIAEVHEQGSFKIIGVGKSPSHGLKKGVVVDIAQTIRSIRTALKEAELMAGTTVQQVAIGVSGGHIQSINSHGVIPIKRGVIHDGDVAAALAAAQAVPIPDGMQVLHVLPQYYVIDSRDMVFDPRGMHGIRLEVQAHIIMGAIACVQNLISCCEHAGVSVTDIVLEQLASADAVLSTDEKDLGVALIDIGGGTSDLAVFYQGGIRHTKVFAVAGNHFTNDLAVGLRTTLKEAERIKQEFGVAHRNYLEHDDFVETEMIQENQRQVIQVSDIVDILQPRSLELLSLFAEELQQPTLKHCLTTGVVLTGGGSLLVGMKDLAERTLQLPVRIGYPHQHVITMTGLENPSFATGCGLLLQAIDKQKQQVLHQGPWVNRIVDRMKTWIGDLF